VIQIVLAACRHAQRRLSHPCLHCI
jgi:hypothetical protein